jgi:zinc protease
MDKGMRFFADVAGRLSLLQSEIEDERQIILEEKRARLSAGQRVQEQVLAGLAPESLIGKRLPIGVEETLLSMNRDEFVNYYSKWYVPSNMTVMVVADADPLAVVEQIRTHFNFGDKSPVPVDQDPGVKPSQGLRAVVATDPEYTGGEISINMMAPKEPPATTKPLARRDMVRMIACDAFNRRIGAKLNKGGTSYTSASAMARNMFNAGRMASASAEGKPEDWRAMLAELGEDVQRARLHGFTAQEIEDVRRETIASLEQFVAQEATMPARAVLGRMNGAIAQGEPLMSAQQELDLARELLPTITAQEVSREFAEVFDPSNAVFVAQLPSGANPPTESELVSLGQNAFSVKPEKQADEARAASLLDNEPAAGKWIEPATHAASGVTSAWLDNGARFHHRFMDVQKERASITITLAAGGIQESAATRGVTDAAGLAWGNPATRRLSSTQIRDLMVGKKADVRGGIGMDSMSLTVGGNPAEIEDGMKLAYLLLTDPVIEPAAFERWKKEARQQIEARRTDPRGAMAEAMADTVYPGGDARVRPLTIEQLEKVTLEAAQSWLNNAIATAPIEVAVVGDIGREQAEMLVAKYVGSLPRRERIGDKTLDQFRNIAKVPGPHVTRRDLKTATPLAMVLSGFYGADLSNVTDTRRMQMSSRILSTRMIQQVREKQGLAYSPSCSHRPGTDFPGFGVFLAATPTEPAKVEKLVEAFDAIYKAYAQDGPTEEEMVTVRKQMANTMDEQMKETQFWNARLATLDYRGTSLDDIMAAPAAYQAFTADELKSTFNQYYKPESMLRVEIRPAAGSDGEPAPKGDDKPKDDASKVSGH